VKVTKVCVRIIITYATTVSVMGVCYPAKDQVEPIVLEGVPVTQFGVGKKHGGTTRLLTVQETGFLSSKDVPFSLVQGADGVMILDSPDQSLFNCRLAKGPGAPIGDARWQQEKGGKVQKGHTFSQDFHVSSAMRSADWVKNGEYSQMDSQCLEVNWKLNRDVESVNALGDATVFDPHLELMFGLRVRDVLGPESSVDFASPLEAGRVTNVMVDVYYHWILVGGLFSM
jgi:hypothetical protein